jgi:hypothetical protein
MSDTVAFRAFRGSRRSSVYREHVSAHGAVARIRAAAEGGGLPLLASLLPPPEPVELHKSEARRLAEEATSIRADATLLELDAELTAIAEVANWCAHARGRAWLRIATMDDVSDAVG